MTNPFEELFGSTGEDGASAPVSVVKSCDGAELDQIMDAWYQERHDNIEYGMILDQARRLLTRILLEGEVTRSTRRRVKSLLAAIEEMRGHERRF